MTFRQRLSGAINILRNKSAGGAYAYGGLTAGGIYNPTTGMGAGADKSELSFFTPTRLYNSYPLEILCVQSWAAKKAVEIRVRDMFYRPRQFENITPKKADDIQEVLAGYDIDAYVRDAMIAGRQYGTSLLVIMTQEAPLDTPLNINAIRKGDFKALQIFNRYDASVWQRDRDPFSPNFRKPVFYDIHPTYGMPFRVHHSRVIRFDGIKDASRPYQAYEADWGISILVPVVQSILQEAGLAQAISHLVQEASIPVLSVEGLRESIAGQAHGEVTAEEIGAGVNRLKSIFRVLMLEKGTEEFKREAVNFGGLADLTDKAARRVAASVDVPFTRFMQDAPRGMNATGDGDYRNYVLAFESERQLELPEVYRRLDEVIFRSEVLGDIPDYNWPSLLTLTEQEKADVQNKNVQSVVQAINSGIIDEDEGRAALDGTELFGELAGPAPGLEDLDAPSSIIEDEDEDV